MIACLARLSAAAFLSSSSFCFCSSFVSCGISSVDSEKSVCSLYRAHMSVLYVHEQIMNLRGNLTFSTHEVLLAHDSETSFHTRCKPKILPPRRPRGWVVARLDRRHGLLLWELVLWYPRVIYPGCPPAIVRRLALKSNERVNLANSTAQMEEGLTPSRLLHCQLCSFLLEAHVQKDAQVGSCHDDMFLCVGYLRNKIVVRWKRRME